MPFDALTTFLQTIHPTDVGYCELRALPSKARAFVMAGDVEGVQWFVDAHAHENVYAGIATRRTKASGDLLNCAELWVLFADVDFKHGGEAAARVRLAACPLPPSLVIHSGGGLHVYWQLKEAIELPDEAAIATSALRRLAHAVGGDPGSAEPARVLRVPGSWNCKPDYACARPVALDMRITPWLM